VDNTAIGGHDLGGSVALSGGQIVINGNEGQSQDLSIETTNLLASNLAAGIAQPFVMSKTQTADGESSRTQFTVYDSLGEPLSVDVTFVKQGNVPGGGTTWQWIAESDDTAAADRVLGLGAMEFDSNGRFVSTTNDAFSISRENGASTPLTITMRFDDGVDSVSALADNASLVAAVRQDGSPIGALQSFSVGEDGVITGSFTNGLAHSIGQVALATFINNEGLVGIGNSLYSPGPNSGNAVIGPPTHFGSGRIIAGAVEASNVDLAEEFVNLIQASTGFSASSRVITTADELIQQLLLVGR
jgi:flagellar hook protein FlgE